MAASKKIGNILKMVLFVFVGIILFLCIESILKPNWNYPENNSNFSSSYESMKTLTKDTQVFFLGTSTIEHAINPLLLYEKYGFVSRNLGSSQQPIVVSYMILKHILERFNPQVIVLDVSGLFTDHRSEAAYCYYLDSMKLGYDKIWLADKYAEDQLWLSGGEKSDYMLQALIPMYKYHTRWDSLTLSDFEAGNYFLEGYLPTSWICGPSISYEENEKRVEIVISNADRLEYGFDNDIFFSKTESDPKYQAYVSDENYYYLNKIAEECEKSGCALLLTKIPVNLDPYIYSESWSKYKHDATQEIADALGVEFIDMNYGNLVDINWPMDGRDAGGHLNSVGALKVTEYLGNHLSTRYKLDIINDAEFETNLVKWHALNEIINLQMARDLDSFCIASKATNNDTAVIIAVNTDMTSNLTDEDKKALRELGLKTDFGKMNYGDSYIAIIQQGEVVYECVSNRLQEYSGLIDEKSLNISSGGAFDKKMCSVRIGGVEYSTNSPGINIVTYHFGLGGVIDSMYLNTGTEIHYFYHNSGGYLNDYIHYMMMSE